MHVASDIVRLLWQQRISVLSLNTTPRKLVLLHPVIFSCIKVFSLIDILHVHSIKFFFEKNGLFISIAFISNLASKTY